VQAVLVGDVHATRSELDDCEALAGLLLSIRSQYPDAYFIFLGDLHDTHEVAYVSVMGFWRQLLPQLTRHGTDLPYLIVGNHDQSTPGIAPHILDAYRDIANVVWPSVHLGPLCLVSYAKTYEDFVSRCRGGGCLIAHQEFAGFVFDNGHVIPGGFPVPPGYKQVISGHLHTPQERGNVWFPGAPRWRNLHDARISSRAVWLVDFAEDGSIVSRTPFETTSVCRRVISAEDSAESPAQIVPGAINRITITGTPEYVTRRREELSAAGARVTAKIVHDKAPTYSESRGMDVNFIQHFRTSVSKMRTPATILAQMIRERLNIEVEGTDV